MALSKMVGLELSRSPSPRHVTLQRPGVEQTPGDVVQPRDPRPPHDLKIRDPPGQQAGADFQVQLRYERRKCRGGERAGIAAKLIEQTLPLSAMGFDDTLSQAADNRPAKDHGRRAARSGVCCSAIASPGSADCTEMTQTPGMPVSVRDRR